MRKAPRRRRLFPLFSSKIWPIDHPTLKKFLCLKGWWCSMFSVRFNSASHLRFRSLISIQHPKLGKSGGDQGYRFRNNWFSIDFTSEYDYICGSFGSLILGQRSKIWRKKTGIGQGMSLNRTSRGCTLKINFFLGAMVLKMGRELASIYRSCLNRYVTMFLIIPASQFEELNYSSRLIKTLFVAKSISIVLAYLFHILKHSRNYVKSCLWLSHQNPVPGTPTT